MKVPPYFPDMPTVRNDMADYSIEVEYADAHIGRALAALEAAGESAVAVFWVATEDHDWAEVSAATVLTPDGPRTFDLGPDPEPLTPVSRARCQQEIGQQ